MKSKVRESRLPLRIYFEDTDAGGIVYHARYLNFFERARTEWLRQLGFEQDVLAVDPGIYFVVKKIAIDYKLAARFNDEISVITRVLRCGRASVEFEQHALRANVCLVDAVIKIGCVGAKTLKPQAMPAAVYSEILHAAS